MIAGAAVIIALARGTGVTKVRAIAPTNSDKIAEFRIACSIGCWSAQRRDYHAAWTTTYSTEQNRRLIAFKGAAF
jgi:hypothetical protein